MDQTSVKIVTRVRRDMDMHFRRILFMAALMLLTASLSVAEKTAQTVEFPGPGNVALLKFLFLSRSPVLNGNFLRVDALSLALTYPGYCRKLEVTEQGNVFVIMSDGTRILYDDRKQKGFEEKLNNPDLEDMMAQSYTLGKVSGAIPDDQDPGRFRIQSFFKAIYGDTEAKVRANLVSVRFCGTKVLFNSQNRAAKALERVSVELSDLMRRKPALMTFVVPLGGTFSRRHIAGTKRLSPHAFGIAIDLNPKKGAYWRWAKESPKQSVSASHYPWEIVEVFERHGFIWGGKWYHYDLMHFEYRPELVTKSRMRGLDRGRP